MLCPLSYIRRCSAIVLKSGVLWPFDRDGAPVDDLYMAASPDLVSIDAVQRAIDHMLEAIELLNLAARTLRADDGERTS